MKKVLSVLVLSLLCAYCMVDFTACEDGNGDITPDITHTHEYVEMVINPTCTTDGYTMHVCACKKWYKDNETAATGHTPESAVQEKYVAPDCVNNGSYDSVVYCSTCGEEISRETTIIPATGHTPASAVQENYVAPDCINNGSYDSVVYCSTCGEAISRETTVIPALGHNYGAASVTKQPTCTEKGEKTATCTRCYETKTEDINATGHNYVNGTCAVCGVKDPNYVEPKTDFELWLDSDESTDYNGDRKITEEDYEIYLDYKGWKVSIYAFDYDGDRKITYDDYIIAKNPENVDLESWLNSDNAYDYNDDGFVDKYDFKVFNNIKPILGKFKINNFSYSIEPETRSLHLKNSKYTLSDLANDISSFNFTISNDLKLSCVYSDAIKTKLGEDETAVQNAIQSCVFEKLSDILYSASFNLHGLDFTLYLMKTENGFSSSINIMLERVSAEISFDMIYVK